MTPGGYLSRRRRAAGLTCEQVDDLIQGRILKLGRWALWPRGNMAIIEATLRHDAGDLVELLEGIFPFDPVVLRRIAEGSETRICRECGCSELDACWDEKRGGCHWVNRDLCSDCQAQGIVG